jgi:hypothetical protein
VDLIPSRIIEDNRDMVRQFRIERLGRVLADDLPATLRAGPRVLLHLLPYSALDPLNAPPITLPIPRQLELPMEPMSVSGCSHRYNFDGFLSFDGDEQNGYVQLFRSGALEAVDARLTSLSNAPPTHTNAIPSYLLERELINSTARYLKVLELVGTTEPIFILVTLTGMKGRYMAVRNPLWLGTSTIDRDVLPFPEVLLSNFEADVPRALRPIMDLVWQASGYTGSPNYDPDGNWKQR